MPEPQLTKAEGQRLNALHHAHLSAVINETRQCVLWGSEGPDALKAKEHAHKARRAFYKYVYDLTGGETGL